MGFLRQRPSRTRATLLTLAMTLSGVALLLAGRGTFRAADPDPAGALTLLPGDHVCIIGNTLADRMQHDGWLETVLQSRFPRHQLVIRNLGFSGDEVAGYTDRPDRFSRLRSMDFGTADQWLAGSAPVPQPRKLTNPDAVPANRFERTDTRADVIFAFFGYNESFAGPAGLDKFKKDFDNFIKHTLSKHYNGKSAPRLVLFSPIAHEPPKGRDLPDGRANNERIELYTAAMAEVAKANRVPFVDLFTPIRALYANTSQPLTLNGVHLTEDGNRELARVIDRALFRDGTEPSRDPSALEKLRQAVLDKNLHWYNRYRAVDGYSTFGERAFLKFTNGQSNYEVVQRELEVLDVMTANRDKRIWAVAQGGDLKVDDGNTPPFIPVVTNKPGPLPGGKHLFLDPEEAIKQMTVAKGMQVNLFASEKEFPELANPVQMSWDPHGRLWVAVWPTYPHWRPKEEMNDKLLVLEDTDGDGKADKMTVFADHLHNPTGFELYNGGVLVAQAPGIVFLKDTDGDGKADVRVRVLDGLDTADTHHTANSFALDPGGALYFQEGTFHHTQVETPYGPPLRNANAGVYRYEPRSQKFEAYVTFSFANPHGHVWDRWGQDIITDGTGANPYHGALFSGYLDFPAKHGRPPQVYQQRTRPCPGIEILSSRHFPPANQGHLLVGNVIGFQGILQYKIEDQGSSLAGTEAEPILSSTDPNFRPSDMKIGPDGAIYFLDWHNPIIGHMQHNLRDPSRDREHGRIYRVTYEGRPLLKPVKIAGEPIEKLLDLLKEPEDRVRYRVRIELGGRDSDRVVAAAKKWAAGLDRTDPEYEHHKLEALWVHQYHDVVDVDLLKDRLASPDFRARAAATRVLCYWRDRVPDALGQLRVLAADPHPRVRLEAVRAASFFPVPEAVEVPLIAAEHPTDVYLDFVRGETMKALEPVVRKAVAAGRKIAFTTDAGARYFLRSLGTDELLKMTRTRAIDTELLFRKGVRDEDRRSALAHLARLDHKSEVGVLIDVIRTQETAVKGQEPADEAIVNDLARLLTSHPAAELAGVRGDLERLATGAQRATTRQIGFVALIAADGGVDKAWALASRSAASLRDLARAMPLVRDPGQRANLYPKVAQLLYGLPKELAAAGPGTPGRYVRVELPGKNKTLALAEVEAYSGGRNVARGGKAAQKSTINGGDASKAIDGNTSGRYADGSITHTAEDTEDPWWEVDLGREYPIDSVVVYNRTDGFTGRRLGGFTLLVLDTDRNVVFQKVKQTAPDRRARIAVGGEAPAEAVRRAAMVALTSVRGQEEPTFKALSRFVRDGTERHAAIQALQHIPATHWPAEEAKPLLDSLIAYVRTTPARERTTPEVLDAMQLADALAALLPRDQAKQVRQDLGELGVQVVRVGTMLEQMLFDKDRLVVRAGKPVEFLFENTDLMPHNFVIVRPGALEEVGTLAEAQATQPSAAEREYVPKSDKVLLSSRLLQPRDSQKLSFTAPAQPGVYPYVCTYPGHWRRMYGALYVVEDLDDYLADAEGYLAKHPLPVADELLKFNRPRKEWTFDELAPAVEQLAGGRSFATGKQMFQVATCVACHKFGGAGQEIGPDLTKLDPKQQKPVEILRDILEPSFRINDKYQTWSFEMNTGKVVTGLVLDETPDVIKVIENPLASAQPIELIPRQILSRQKVPTSIMPKGLLDKLTKEEILDLIAYVAAGGNPGHALFRGGHDHGHGPGH
jgi:putative heme-binding domain-containing protein